MPDIIYENSKFIIMSLMKIKCLGDIEIDPETCPLDELERIMNLCKREEDYWNTMQLSAKTFINSVYGVFGTSYFNLANIDIAESITLQGQDLIKYSVIKVDDYFKNKWHLDFEGHKRVSDIMINEYGFKNFDRDNFERMAKVPLQFNTLQVYGDSCTGDSLISLSDGYMTIEDMFNEVSNDNNEDKIRVQSNRCVKVFSQLDFQTVVRPIAYIMRHRVNKKIYRVLCETGNHVDVTEDHSIVVARSDDDFEKTVYFRNVKPTEINIKTDRVISIYENGNPVLHKIKSIELLLSNVSTYVYDISVLTNKNDEHNFFANNICIHNTDSVSGDTIVRTEKHPEGIKFSDFYNENSDRPIEYFDNHESVLTDDKILNYNNILEFSNISRIIRHKVSKKKWKLKTSKGKEIICTEDHSLIVFRDGEKIKVKPSEIKKSDKILTISENIP